LSNRARAVRTVLDRARASVAVLCKLDIINRYSESARLYVHGHNIHCIYIHVRFCNYIKYAHSSHRYGITLFDVITRGSQYRVEAVLMRVMKPLGYCAPSANKVQVAQQASIEVIPLVLEPNSQFYVDPVLVLDFQSLYPSMILAYNLCYSTCLGTRSKFFFLRLQVAHQCELFFCRDVWYVNM
jgi:DNA polymerase zeta